MMKKNAFIKVILVLIVALIITSCSKPISTPIEESTQVPKVEVEESIQAPTPQLPAEPTSISPEMPIEGSWICEKDPAFGTILDLREHGKYHAGCYETNIQGINGLIINFHPNFYINTSIYTEKIEKGDSISFRTLARGVLVLLSQKSLDNLLVFHVNGEEWFLAPGLESLQSKDGKRIIPEDTEVKIEALNDLDFSFADIWIRTRYIPDTRDAKKGDSLTFEMPATGMFFPHSGMFWKYGGEGKGYFDYRDDIRISVNGEEWSFSPISEVLFSDRGEFMIPKGAEIKIEVLRDLEYPLIDYIGHIQLERTLPEKIVGERIESIFGDKWRCTDGVQYGHVLSEQTEVDLGHYGVVRPLCNPETNRWFISFSEFDAIVAEGITDVKTLIEIYEGREIFFIMPADGFIVYDPNSVDIYASGYGGIIDIDTPVNVARTWAGWPVLIYLNDNFVKNFDISESILYIDFIN